jgi:hypothetical protein
MERVQRNTSEDVNRDIQRQTNLNILYYADHPEEIDQHLQELDEEWDIERLLEANAASLVLIGLGLGALVDRRFYAVPAVVGGFLLQHAIQGWCPPLTIFRRMGIRTRDEIDRERYAIKALRGDFDEVAMDFDPNTRMGAVLAAVAD